MIRVGAFRKHDLRAIAKGNHKLIAYFIVAKIQAEAVTWKITIGIEGYGLRAKIDRPDSTVVVQILRRDPCLHDLASER